MSEIISTFTIEDVKNYVSNCSEEEINEIKVNWKNDSDIIVSTRKEIIEEFIDRDFYEYSIENAIEDGVTLLEYIFPWR